MRDALNTTSIKNTVGMLRNYDDKSILLLEGHSDLVALADAINRATCQPLVAGGKIEAIEAVEWSDGQGFKGVLALVDLDLVDLVEERSRSSNVFYTDSYDLDSLTFFEEGIVERCIEAMCSLDRHGSVEDAGASHAEVKNKAVCMAGLVGRFRLYSARDGRFISLDKFPFGEVYKGVDLALNVDKLRGVMLGRLKEISDAEQIFEDWLRRADIETTPIERVCQGHDLYRSLSLIISKVHGQNHRGEVWERIARSHLKIEHFRSTQFYAAIVSWCTANKRTVWVT